METPSQFILIAKRIQQELRALREAVSGGFLGIQKQVETIAKEQDSKNEREQITPVLRAEFQLPEAVQSQKRAYDRRKERRERWSLVVAWVTLFSVISYAIVNYHMLHEMKKATEKAGISADAAKSAANTAARELELSERPWMAVGNPRVMGPMIVTASGEAQITVDVIAENIGKTPAREVAMQLALGPGTGKEDVQMVQDLCAKHISLDSLLNLSEVVFPGKTLSPGLFRSASANLSKAPWAHITENEWYLPRSVIGCVHYKSIVSDNSYFTGFIYVNIPRPERELGRVLFNPSTKAALTVPPKLTGVGRIEIPGDWIRLYVYPDSGSIAVR